jgi:uncharacterized protein involved in outer membrane biogenesis
VNGRWLVRRLLILAGAAAAFVVLLAVVVPLVISGDAVRERAVQALEEATGADIALGSARLAVLPRLAVRLEDGRISGDGAGLRRVRGDDFGIASYEIVLSEARAAVSLWALLRREVEVGEVTVAGPSLVLVREGKRLEVTDWRATIRDLSVSAEAPAPVAADAAPGEKIPADLALTALAEAARVDWEGLVLDGVAARGRLKGRVLAIDSLEAGLGGGGISGTATVDYAADPWGRLAFDAQAAAVPAAALLGPFSGDLARRLEGDLTASAKGGCALRDPAAVRASLDLAGRVTSGPGVLHAADWLRDVSPYLGRRQDLKDIRFTTLEHDFRVENGRWLVDGLVLDGGETRWQADGSVALDGILDLAVQVKLPPGFTPDLGTWSFLAETLREDDGRVRLDLTLSGPAARPAVGLDLSELKAGAADKGGEAVQKAVGSLLDKWKSK